MGNNIINAFYKFEKSTCNNRFDCTESTNNYDLFEKNLKNKIGFNSSGISVLFDQNQIDFNFRNYRTDICLTHNGNIANLKLYDLSEPFIFYGFIDSTNDAIIAKFNKGFFGIIESIEIFIAKGNKRNASDVCHELITHALDIEIEHLKEISIKFDFPL